MLMIDKWRGFRAMKGRPILPMHERFRGWTFNGRKPWRGALLWHNKRRRPIRAKGR